MNAFDKKINNELLELAKLKQEKIAEMAKVTNAKAGEELDKEIGEINDKIQKIADDLGVDISEVADKLDRVDEDKEEKGKNKRMNYLETKKADNAFAKILMKSDRSKIVEEWKTNLATNGIEITDTSLQLPKRYVEAIQSKLLEANPVFPLFKITNMGAMIVSSLFGSNDGALVHTDGADKTEQAATLTISTLAPVMVYKLQSIPERVRRSVSDYSSLFETVVAELTQAIINKVVDLALIEGDATNGFQAIMTDKRTDFVSEIKGQTTLIAGFEKAVEFVSRGEGIKNLIVTPAQRTALVAELRTAYPNAGIKNNNEEIASWIGVDKIVTYYGAKAIKPIVLRSDAYHVDMDNLTRVEAFEWLKNENKILVETLAAGHLERIYGAAFVTVATV